MKSSLRKLTLAATLLLAVAVPGISSAQETGTTGARTGATTSAQSDDDGFDLGWLGLLGLAGLAGLAGRKHHNEREVVAGRRAAV